MLLEPGCELWDALAYDHIVANLIPQDRMAQTIVFTVGDSLSFFCVWISSFPVPFFEETHLSPLCVFSSIVKDQLIIYVRDSLWALYSVSLFLYVCFYVSNILYRVLKI